MTGSAPDGGGTAFDGGRGAGVTGGPVSGALAGPGVASGSSRGTAAPTGRRRRLARRGPIRWKVAFFVLTAVGLAGAVAWALLGSHFLVVRSVQVTGTHLVPKSEVIAAAHIPLGLPLVRVNTAAAARRVERITQIASAQVTRQWPDRILIAVRERTPVVAVPAHRGFYLVDGSGVVVRQVTKRPRGIPLFILPGSPLDAAGPPAAAPLFTLSGPRLWNPGLRAAVAVLRELPAGIARRVTSVIVPGDQAVTLHLAQGITVDWGNSGQPARKARELAILLRTGAHYYDVSAPGSAVTG
jgi:cell division protein FtsQ